MRAIIFLLVAVASVPAQPILRPTPRFPEALREFLALNDAQTTKISDQNGALVRWTSDRSRRMFQVQAEIFVETAREPLDPSALGLRYAEVEAIRREIAERTKKQLAENVAVLTPAQQTKLKALEEALKLVSTGYEAKAVRLLPDECAPAGFASFLVGAITPVMIAPGGGFPLPAPCTVVSQGIFGGIFDPQIP